MANIGGDKTKRVNAQYWELFISSTSNEWLYLQELDTPITSPVIVEPTTLGVNVPFTALPKNKISGVILFTTDAWAAAVSGWNALLVKTNGEKPIITVITRTTDASGGTITLTYTNGCMLETLDPKRAGEGAVKVSFSFSAFVDPTQS